MINRIFIDTEFIDTGSALHLVSLGAARDQSHGQDAFYYAEVEGAPLDFADDWVKENVLPKLSGRTTPRVDIASQFLAWCGEDPEFWGAWAAHDWVLLCRLYGRLIEMPKHWPRNINDVVQLSAQRGIDHDAWPTQPEHREHHAVWDAIWTKQVYEFLTK